MKEIKQGKMLTTEDWLDFEYPESGFEFDRCIITKKIQSMMRLPIDITKVSLVFRPLSIGTSWGMFPAAICEPIMKIFRERVIGVTGTIYLPSQ